MKREARGLFEYFVAFVGGAIIVLLLLIGISMSAPTYAATEEQIEIEAEEHVVEPYLWYGSGKSGDFETYEERIKAVEIVRKIASDTIVQSKAMTLEAIRAMGYESAMLGQRMAVYGILLEECQVGLDRGFR